MKHLQGSHRLEKYLNLEGFLEKSLKIKSALKSTVRIIICQRSYNSSKLLLAHYAKIYKIKLKMKLE